MFSPFKGVLPAVPALHLFHKIFANFCTMLFRPFFRPLLYLFCTHLAAQCEIPPPYRAIPFRDSIAEGGIASICLVFIGYRESIAEIPLLRGGGGYRTSTSHVLKGGNAEKRGRGYRTQFAMLRHQKPTARSRGVSLR